jgi:hypothetical protein
MNGPSVTTAVVLTTAVALVSAVSVAAVATTMPLAGFLARIFDFFVFHSQLLDWI